MLDFDSIKRDINSVFTIKNANITSVLTLIIGFIGVASIVLVDSLLAWVAIKNGVNIFIAVCIGIIAFCFSVFAIIAVMYPEIEPIRKKVGSEGINIEKIKLKREIK